MNSSAEGSIVCLQRSCTPFSRSKFSAVESVYTGGQRIDLLRLLCSQDLSADHLNTAFNALVVSRTLYVLLARGVFLNAGQSGRIDAILKRAYKVVSPITLLQSLNNFPVFTNCFE